MFRLLILAKEVLLRRFILSLLISVTLGLVPTVNMAQEYDYDTYGPTTEKDHLWHIAIEMSPSKWITPQQEMIAIQMLNPKAFNEGNINGLRKGVLLKIPTLEMVQKINPLTAELKVAYQNKHWHASEDKQSAPIAKIKVPIKPVAPIKRVSLNTDITPTFSQMQHKIDRISHEVQKQLEQAKLRIDVLEDENVVLKKQVLMVSSTLHKLSDKLTIEEQEFSNMIADLRAHQSDISAFFAEYGGFLMVAGGLIVLMFLVYGIFYSRRRPDTTVHQKETERQGRRRSTHSFVDNQSTPLFENEKPTSPKRAKVADSLPPPQQEIIYDDDDDEEEYDYLNSEEGIAAKLDLARAYIDMGDFETARQVLREVRENGKPDLQQQAQQILEKMTTSPAE